MDWDYLYCNLITITGWTWEYIDDFMTLPRLDSLMNYWKIQPPVHFLVAGLAGYKPPEKASNNLNELMTLFEQMGGEVINDNHNR